MAERQLPFDDRVDGVGHTVSELEDGFFWSYFDNEDVPVAGSSRGYDSCGDALRAAADEWEGCGGDHRTAAQLRRSATRADAASNVAA